MCLPVYVIVVPSSLTLLDGVNTPYPPPSSSSESRQRLCGCVWTQTSLACYGAQSPGDPDPGGGPTSGGPDQTSSRPHERSTRTASPRWTVPPPEGLSVATSPARTASEASNLPLGARASTFHGSVGSSLLGSGTRSTCAGTRSISVPFTKTVTSRLVPLEMLRSAVPAGGAGDGVGGAAHAPAMTARHASTVSRGSSEGRVARRAGLLALPRPDVRLSMPGCFAASSG
jgi:hypothetical protein